jgi:DNA-binding protein HU-beta
VNKTELVERIADETTLPKGEVQKYWEAFEQAIGSTLKSGDEVQITGFGKFYVQERKAREGRNPRRGRR